MFCHVHDFIHTLFKTRPDHIKFILPVICSYFQLSDQSDLMCFNLMNI